MSNNKSHLDRGLGLLHATASNMATMVGIGPFITFPLIVSAMGGPQAMLGWVAGAVIAISDGQVWAELSTSLRGEGGSYVYLREAYKKYFGKLIAFLFIWSFLLSGPLEIASGYVGMVHYISFIWPALTETHIRLLAFTTGIFTIVLHYNRIKFVGAITIILWIIMLITVALTIFVGITHFNPHNAFDFPDNWFSFSWGFLMGLGGSTLIAMYDLLGYYNICYVEEEVKNPEYVFPRAIIWSVVGVTLLYAVMNFLVLGVLPWQEVAKSTHIISDIFNKFYGNTFAIVITVLVAFTAYGSIYSLMMSYSRLPFAAARDGFFFDWLKAIHPEKHFPHYSLLLVGGITCIASLLDLGFIIAATLSSRILIQFLGQIIGLTLLRKDNPELKRPFKMWLYPIPSIIAFIGFSFIFISSGIEAISLGLIWIAIGTGFYLLWAKHNMEWPFQFNKSS
ncbi:MAG: amino acid permease [Ignavibacterium album]|uniref:APC family permease n=1 Tax=Ignavibacterium album TaxID=591197 RepID=UPI0026F05C19|nr:amino acid permease [Ignavibacterium album]MBI5662140.1 amino acid permease [Ignavibacterium album]